MSIYIIFSFRYNHDVQKNYYLIGVDNMNKNENYGKIFLQDNYKIITITLTNLQGDILSWAGGEKVYPLSDRKNLLLEKSTIETVINKAKDCNLKAVEVYTKGHGLALNNLMKSLKDAEIKVRMIKDITPIPHNGCRPPQKRIYNESNSLNKVKSLKRATSI